MTSVNLTTVVLTRAIYGVPFFTIMLYVLFRGFCVIINNACVRIIEWCNDGGEPIE
jgi:hypothetical protein